MRLTQKCQILDFESTSVFVSRRWPNELCDVSNRYWVSKLLSVILRYDVEEVLGYDKDTLCQSIISEESCILREEHEVLLCLLSRLKLFISSQNGFYPNSSVAVISEKVDMIHVLVPSYIIIFVKKALILSLSTLVLVKILKTTYFPALPIIIQGSSIILWIQMII